LIIYLHFQTGSNIMRSIGLIRGKNGSFSMTGQQQSRTSGTEKRTIQLAGSAVEDSLDLGLDFLFLFSSPPMAA